MPLLCAPHNVALADQDIQGLWTTPNKVLVDLEDPGFLVNLGQTGPWTVLTDKPFIFKKLFKDTTTVGPLKLDDEFIGVFGKAFTAYQYTDSRGYEGLFMGLGGSSEKAPRCSRGLPFNSSNIESTTELS
jgi:hypothetical protein